MVGPAGAIGGRAGVITCAADSLQIRLFGRGVHGSMPQASIDPVVMAAATVMRLQTIVSRELAAAEAAVVTIGSLQAGTKENVIPEEAVTKLNVRSFEQGVRQRVLAAIERIVNAESAASEDFGSFGAEWHAPSVFWFVGGTDPDRSAKARQAGSTRSRPTTIRALRRLAIRPCRPASRL
jgi:metal-dependent amidase/aminoacylase/carboxypeptidase family protein